MGLTSSSALSSAPQHSNFHEEKGYSNLMGSLSKRESHLLKLVHPGGFVEIHTKPVMASQVMNKNPRHCVTRPDIFRFPWIVVSPESILTPGNVFFIVPCHTIRCLLKNPTNINTLKPHHHRHEPHADDNQGCYISRKLSKSKKTQCFSDQSSASQASMSCVNLRTKTPREAHHKQHKSQSFVRERPIYYSSEHSCSQRDAAKERAISKPRGVCHCEKVPKLKPCLKKVDNMSHNVRSRNLRVRFREDLSFNTYTYTTEVN